MLNTQKGQDIIRRIPHERVLIETDGPFIKIGSTPANPLCLSDTVQSLANLWNTEVDATFQQLSDNFNTLLFV
jgi:TatD DNase family protein